MALVTVVGYGASVPGGRERREPMAIGGGQSRDAVVIDLAARLRARRRDGAVDQEVLDAARAGDPHAWSQIYRWLAGPVRGYLAGRGGTDLDDLLGEVFVQLSRGIHTFEGDVVQFRSWVFIVAHNRVLDERRRQRRDRCEARPVEDLEDIAHQGDAELDALARMGEDRIRALLAPLTNDQRSVLLLRFVADLSIDETAAVLGKPAGSVKSLQLRALRGLQRSIGRRCDIGATAH